MKRRFASPLTGSQDSSFGNGGIPRPPKANRLCHSSQTEMRRFTSPVVVKPALKSYSDGVSNFTKAQQFAISNLPEDESMEVPKTPNPCSRIEPPIRNVSRRLFHASERESQLSNLFSSATRLAPPRPPLLQRTPRASSVRFGEPHSGDLRKNSGCGSSIFGQSTQLQPRSGDSEEILEPGRMLQPFQQPNQNDVSGTNKSDGNFLQSGRRPSVFQETKLVLSTKKSTEPSTDNNQEASKCGGQLPLFQQVDHVQRIKSNDTCKSQDVSQSGINGLECAVKLAPTNICILEVLTPPPTLKDIGALSCNRASSLERVIEYCFGSIGSSTMITKRLNITSWPIESNCCDNYRKFVRNHVHLQISEIDYIDYVVESLVWAVSVAAATKEVNLPSPSARESGLKIDIMKKLKLLLVPSSVPSPHPVQPNQVDITTLRPVLELDAVHLQNHSSGDSIKKDAERHESIHLDIRDEKSTNECEIISSEDFYSNAQLKIPSTAKSTWSSKVISAGALNHNSHPRFPSQHNRANNEQIISDGASYDSCRRVSSQVKSPYDLQIVSIGLPYDASHMRLPSKDESPNKLLIVSDQASYDNSHPSFPSQDKKANNLWSSDRASADTSDLRLSSVEESSFNLHKISDGPSDDSSHPEVLSGNRNSKGLETIACAESRKECLSPSSLYDAQSLEFHRIWSSKRLKMAEVEMACMLQSDYLFNYLV